MTQRMPYLPSNGGLTNGQSSVIEVVNPPNDNFNSNEMPNTFQSSGYYHENGNGTMSYGNPSVMINNMVHQMMTIAQNNRELKDSIRQNNHGFQSKLMELQKWKESWKSETAKIRQHYQTAKTTVLGLRRDKVMLEAENTKLKILINSQSKSSDDGEEDAEKEHFHLSPDDVHSKSLATIEGLEKQLKVALSEKEVLEKDKQHLQAINQRLQLTLHSNQDIFRKHETEVQEHKRVNQALLMERERYLQLNKDQDTTIRELKAQVVSMLDESKVYELEIKQANAAVDKRNMENKDLQTRLTGINATIAKVKKEKQAVQNRLEKEIAKFQSQLSEKSSSFEQLFDEFERVRVENEQHKMQQSTENLDDMYARLLCGEESLQKKDRELKDLEERFKTEKRQADAKLQKLQEDLDFFKVQADIYKSDFLIERDDRSKLHEQNQKHRNLLFEREREIEQLKNKIEQMKFEMMRR